MGTDRIQRLLRLIMLLQGGPPRGVEALAATLGVSRRTLFRDLKVLEEAGIPYYHESGVGYRLGRSFFLPPLNLNVSETLGLMLLAKASSSYRGQPLLGPALSAFSKLIATVDEPVRTACTDMLRTVSINPGPQPMQTEEASAYPTLQQCVDQERTCRILYSGAAEKKQIDLRLKPYALHFSTRSWYVVGHSDLHNEVRVFKLGRIEQVDPTDDRFTRPKNFHVSDKLGKAWELIAEGQEHAVELIFSEKVSRNVMEVRWHSTQQQELLDDGRARLRFTVDGLNEIAWWLCGYADQVYIVEPPALREKVAQMHRDAAELGDR